MQKPAGAARITFMYSIPESPRHYSAAVFFQAAGNPASRFFSRVFFRSSRKYTKPDAMNMVEYTPDIIPTSSVRAKSCMEPRVKI
jgi:hypothetical protein